MKTLFDVGATIGFVEIVEIIGERPSRKGFFYKAKCIRCGNIFHPTHNNISRGLTNSCGCTRSSHGKTRTRTYKSWSQMKQRCSNSSATGFENYGGRGISVCDRWVTFENFLSDMGERPEGRSLDRIDPNGNYEPSNCRWASPKEQHRNRTNNSKVTYDGKTATVAELAESAGITHAAMRWRLKRWAIERSINESKRTH